MRKDVKDLHADLMAVLEAIKDGAKGKASSVRERVEDAVEKGEDRVREAAESLKECGCKVREHVVAALKDKPVLTILAAVGAGAILHCLCKWRHRS